MADPSATGTGQRMFDVVANGTTLVLGYDPYAAAGAQNKAVELDVTVTVTGGKGLALNLVNNTSTGATLGAFVNGIELDRVVAGGTASPTATIQVSTDDGATWSTIASNVAVNRFGLGQYVWTVDRTTTGNTALIRVTVRWRCPGCRAPSCSPMAAPPTTSMTALRWATNTPPPSATTQTSGKSPDQPLASLGALLRAYTLQAGDTVYVDTGSYTLATDLTLGTADSGTAASRIFITGPTNGGTATLDRANLSSGTTVFHISASDVTLANLVLQNASTVVDVTAGAGLMLLNDTVQGSGNAGIDLEGGDGISNFTLTGSTLRNNTHEGILINSGNTGALVFGRRCIRQRL